MNKKLIVAGPLGNRAMAFQAAMGNHRAAIHSFYHRICLLECIFRLAFYRHGILLIWRVGGGFWSFPLLRRLNGFNQIVPNLFVMEPLNDLWSYVEADATLLQKLDDFRL